MITVSVVFCCLLITSLAHSDDAKVLVSLRDSLTFHASFDGKIDADFAKGDPKLYHASVLKPEQIDEPGLPPDSPDVVMEKGKGRFGDSLHFVTGQAPKVFFRVRDNLPYAERDWRGTVSFWLRTTPDEDLVPGYTDPIQITPRTALDACLFFEFGIEDPRPCRLGVYPDTVRWNPDGKASRDIPLTHRPLITVTDPPFSRERWTHVVFTFRGFNRDDDTGVARLYLDGRPRGDLMSWPQHYTWDLEKSEIRLGVKYVGGFDELACFDRTLTEAEVMALHGLETGVATLR